MEPLKVIDKIRFGLLSPEEIRKLSVARIITADTYDEDGLPIKSGLMDGKLGTIEPGTKCTTCGNRVGACSGHFGHIELARPVVHVGHAKLLLKILRGICTDCSRVLLTETQIEDFKNRQSQFIDVFEHPDESIIQEIFKTARKTKECHYCGAVKKKITIEKPTTYYEEGERLTPVDIRERLAKMNSEDCEILGINPETAKPEWMILTVLPIPPVCVRPSITLDSGIRSEDDLTHKLVDVIRINQRLRENIDAGAPQLIVEDLWELLQYHVTTYFNNEVSGIPPARHRSGRALRTLTQRLKGKEGRFRSNLSGKRVDFSARTVISPNPHISLNQVGVPERIAKILTVPTYVTEYNIEEMKQIVLNGPKIHPGANYIIREDGRRIDLRFVKARETVVDQIKPGFIIERHLKDGDLVLFNRQPSLHRMSIMAHEVKVMPGQTFRLSLVVCPPYNADFDGDEMNLHVPQSEEARTEAEYLLKVQEHIISPRFGGPIIGAIHDFISLGYMFTRNERAKGVPNIFSRKDTYSLLFWGNVFHRNPAFSLDQLQPVNPSDPPEEWKFSGKTIFSCILPHDLNLEIKSKFYRDGDEKITGCDGYVKIVNGHMFSGVIDKNLMGEGKSTSILHRIIRDYGPNRGRQFLDDFCGLMVWAMTLMGLTMGIDEVDIAIARSRVHAKIYESYAEANKLIKAYNEEDEEILPCAPGRTLYETLELNLMSLLNKVRGDAGSIAAEHLGDTAHSVIMTKSGARGNPLNLAQMAACVGQQSVRQERIHRGYIDRTLPHFHVKDLSPEARGFVLNSYRTGLTPTEFFFHAMGGREGLVDTAVRTSSSGYMQRRLVNALQDMVVENDLTVRTSEKNIIQFRYGDDGVDPGRSDAGDIIDFDQVVLKTRQFKDLMKKEENLADTAKSNSHPEFPVDFFRDVHPIPTSESTIKQKRLEPKEEISIIPEISESLASELKEEAVILPEHIKEDVIKKKEGKVAVVSKKSKPEKVVEPVPVSPEITPIELHAEKPMKKGSKSKLLDKMAEKEGIKLKEEEIETVPSETETPSSSGKTSSKVDLSKKSFSSLTMEERYQLYAEETGNKAISRGRTTKQYKDWEAQKTG